MIGNTLFNNIASMKKLNSAIRNQIENELRGIVYYRRLTK